jgi:hypothetical protein
VRQVVEGPFRGGIKDQCAPQGVKTFGFAGMQRGGGHRKVSDVSDYRTGIPTEIQAA